MKIYPYQCIRVCGRTTSKPNVRCKSCAALDTARTKAARRKRQATPAYRITKFVLKALGTVAILLWTVSAEAQANTLEWDQPNATPAEAMAMTWTVKVDTAAAIPAVATCATLSAATHCSTPIAALTSGATHTVTLTATTVMGSASSSISGKPPDAAVNIKIVITISVP